jgi:hypothetical protein
MSNHIDDHDFDDDEEDVEETKASRQRRLNNKNKRDKRRDFQEQRIRPLRQSKPRVRIVYDPDYDEDDYEEYM